MEAIFSSETSVDTQRTTRGYIPEDDTLYNHRCENLKSYKIYIAKYSYIKWINVLFRKFGHVGTLRNNLWRVINTC
jgi:hypothetical protein